MKFFRPPAPRLILGSYGLWNRKKLVLESGDISTHMHLIGLTGMGKSKFLASIFVQLVEQGIPAALIDPHSDLADDALAMLHERRIDRLSERVLHIDFRRRDRFLPFNILKGRYSDHDTARHVVEVCKRVWPGLSAGQAPMFENVMLASVLTLIQSGLPIVHVPRLITDKSFRDMSLQNVRDPMVTHFFRSTFDRLRPVDQLDQAQSSLRRVFLLTFSETLRYSLGQTGNALDFRALMDDGVSVIYDLGGLDEDTQRFLGALLTVGYEVAALSRADIPQEQRKPYHLILDEFSQFSAQSEEALSRILSLARKYGLFLVLSHQTWSQLSYRLQGALANTMSIAFKLGRSDAEWMSKRLTHFDPHAVRHMVEDEHAQERGHPMFYGVPETFEKLTGELTTLPKRQVVVKHEGEVMRIKTLDVPPSTISAAELFQIKETYAKRLLRPRSEVVEEVDGSLSPEPDRVPDRG